MVMRELKKQEPEADAGQHPYQNGEKVMWKEHKLWN